MESLELTSLANLCLLRVQWQYNAVSRIEVKVVQVNSNLSIYEAKQFVKKVYV